jgi:hypothetical protein
LNPCQIAKTIYVCSVTDSAQQDTGKICAVILEKNGDFPPTNSRCLKHWFSCSILAQGNLVWCRKVPEDRAGGVPGVHVPAVLVPAPQAMTCTQQKIASVLMFVSFLVSKEVGGWVAMLIARLLAKAALWVRNQTSLRMGDISKGVSNTQNCSTLKIYKKRRNSHSLQQKLGAKKFFVRFIEQI